MTMSGSKFRRFLFPNLQRFFRWTLSKRAGFTLLEMMVAVCVIAIALTSVYKLHAQTIRLNSVARFNTIAPLLAQERIALIDSQPIEDVADDSGEFEDGFEKYTYNVVVEETPSEYLETSADLGKDSGLILKKITIEIAGGEYGQTYRVSTYRVTQE